MASGCVEAGPEATGPPVGKPDGPAALDIAATTQVSNGVPLDSPLPCKNFGGGFEPGIEVDEDGVIFVTAPSNGCPTPEGGESSLLWISYDDGATFEQVSPVSVERGVSNLPTGLEGDVAIDGSGTVYFVDMTLASSTLTRSTDSGRTWELRNPIPFHEPVGDRPWVTAASEDMVALSWDLTLRPGGQTIQVAVSRDGGLTFPTQTKIPPCAGFPGYEGGYQNGVPVFAPDGALHVSANCQEGIAVYSSADGGESFDLNVVAETGPLPRDFVPLAVDAAGALAIAWVEEVSGNTEIRVSRSLDGGATWTEPNTVSRHGGSSMMPWIDGRHADRFVVGYYGTPDARGRPDAADGRWFPYVALIDAATGAVTHHGPAATNPAVSGRMCHAGGACAVDASDALIDYFEVEDGPSGEVHVVWTAVDNDGVSQIHWARVSASA